MRPFRGNGGFGVPEAVRRDGLSPFWPSTATITHDPRGSGPPRMPMSALGQKATLRRHNSMSALPPKADMDPQFANVRFVPKSSQGFFLAGLAVGCVGPDIWL
jgi:hypothetical protein